jgi:Pex14 N-terminal domain/PUB domain
MTDSQPAREQEVVQALRFLQDPRVLNAPRQQKESFLVSKGLTQHEISQALARADAALPFLSAPVGPPESLWSMIGTTAAFVAAMGAGAFFYQLWLDHNAQSRQVTRDDKELLEQMQELKRAVRDLSAASEYRSKEQLKVVKELVGSQSTLQTTDRKPASSIMMTSPDTTASVLSEEPKIEDVSEEELIRELKTSQSLPTVQMLLQNLVAYPGDDKYRKINLASDRFKIKIGSGPGLELLKAVGFMHAGDLLTFPRESGLISEVERILLALES